MSAPSLRQRTFDVFLKNMNRAHQLLLKVSGGRVLGSIGGMPSLELHTVGRKTGERRTVMLIAPIAEPDRLVLVASKGGDDRHPAWYLNLLANPAVSITLDGNETRWIARRATDAEKAELWPRIVGAYSGYAGYQEKTDRDIPVVICSPV